MEIKIGIRDTSRELVFESGSSPDEVQKKIAKALTAAQAGDGLLDLSDEKGRRYLVPAANLAYVEIGQPAAHRIGFGA